MNYPVANKDLRLLMKQAGLPLWRVAKSMGISEITLSRWLRVEVEPLRKAMILNGIEKAKEAEKEVEVDAHEDFGNAS